ncbi:MAG: MBL fold metallo-hydrolase [Thermoplasmatota archaeon]
MLPPGAGRFVAWIDEGVGLVDGGEGGASSLVINDGDVIVVDAGMPDAAAKELAPHTSVMLLSHAHPRHTRQAKQFSRVWAPKAEINAFRDAEGLLEILGIARQDREIVRGWFEKSGWAPLRIDKTVHPGTVLILPRTEWRVVPTPGHSPGLFALYEPRRRILFAPDLPEAETPAAYAWPSADLDEVESSMARLAELDVELLVTSHGPPRRRGVRQVLRDLPALLRRRDAEFYEVLETPRSVAELVDLGKIQGPLAKTDPMGRYFERVMVEKHMGRLLARGLAFARQDGKYQQA